MLQQAERSTGRAVGIPSNSRQGGCDVGHRQAALAPTGSPRACCCSQAIGRSASGHRPSHLDDRPNASSYGLPMTRLAGTIEGEPRLPENSHEHV
jgi:hypothetical protein